MCPHNGIKNQANSNFAVILIRKEKYPHYMHGLLFPQSRPVTHVPITASYYSPYFCSAPDNSVHLTAPWRWKPLQMSHRWAALCVRPLPPSPPRSFPLWHTHAKCVSNNGNHIDLMKMIWHYLAHHHSTLCLCNTSLFSIWMDFLKSSIIICLILTK